MLQMTTKLEGGGAKSLSDIPKKLGIFKIRPLKPFLPPAPTPPS